MSPHIHLQHEHLVLVFEILECNKISPFAAVPQALIPLCRTVPYRIESCYHNYGRFGYLDSHPGQHQTEIHPTCSLPLPRRPSKYRQSVSAAQDPWNGGDRAAVRGFHLVQIAAVKVIGCPYEVVITCLAKPVSFGLISETTGGGISYRKAIATVTLVLGKGSSTHVQTGQSIRPLNPENC